MRNFAWEMTFATFINVGWVVIKIRNGPSTIPLYALVTGAEPTPKLSEPGFENEV